MPTELSICPRYFVRDRTSFPTYKIVPRAPPLSPRAARKLALFSSPRHRSVRDRWNEPARLFAKGAGVKFSFNRLCRLQCRIT